ncbi:MAG: hypothetical protein JNL74_10830, partial [Fibrobacteres bacterium]|nr:hypothetical protein [Fibrobacterota bacterium]
MRSAICTFATFSLFLFSLMSCDSTKPDSNDYVKPGYGAVDGKLVDGNNKPQSGWIFILGYNSIALSDTTGSFYLNNVPVGAHTVYINFDDGPSRRLQVTVDDGKVVHLGDVKPGEDNVNGNESNRHYGANYNWSRAGESYPYGNYLNQFYSNDDTNSLPIEILTNDTLLSKIGCYYYSSYEGYRSELPYYIMMDNQKVCEGFTKKFIAYNKI